MGRRVSVPLFPDRVYSLSLRLTGSLKQEIIKAAAAAGLSVNQWVLWAIRRQIDSGEGIPAPALAPRAMPTESEILQSIMDGEPLMMPCGRRRGQCVPLVVDLGGVKVCRVCNLRVD